MCSKQIASICSTDRWLILGIAAVVLMICFGPMNAIGAVFVTMMDTYDTDRAETAVVQSVHIGIAFSSGLISGALVTKFGPTTVLLLASVLHPLGFCIAYFARSVLYLSLTFGVISGVGVSFVLVSSIVVAERIFDGSQRFLCISLLNMSTIIPASFYSYFLRWLTDSYSLNGMFLILGGLACNVFVLFTVCRTSKTVVQCFTKELDKEAMATVQVENNSCWKTDFSKLKSSCVSSIHDLFTKSYLLVFVATGLSLGSIDGYFGLIVDVALTKGMSSSEGVTSYTAFYISTAVSSLLAGILKQKKRVDALLLLILSTTCGGLGYLLIYCISNYVTFMTGTLLLGITFGGIIASSVNAAVQLVQAKQVPLAAGCLYTVEGILTLCAGPFFGFIRDVSGSYEIVLLLLMSIEIVCTGLYALALVYHRQNKVKQECEIEISATTRL